MKRILLSMLLLSTALFHGCVVFPIRQTYTPRLVGTIEDVEGRPIEGATIERRDIVQPHGGRLQRIYWEVAVTDSMGKFDAEPDRRINWVHWLMALPYVWCGAEFRVTHPEYEAYEPQLGDDDYDQYQHYNKNGRGCRGVRFDMNIQLEKLGS